MFSTLMWSLTMVANLRKTLNCLPRIRRGPMSPQVARQILTWHVSPADRRLVGELLEKNREGTISPGELEWLQNCVVMGEWVDLLQAKAKLTLKWKRKQQVV
jgi:hypothetical protein